MVEFCVLCSITEPEYFHGTTLSKNGTNMKMYSQLDSSYLKIGKPSGHLIENAISLLIQISISA